MSLRLNQFTFATKDLRLPQGAVAYVVDRTGTSLQFGASGVPLALPNAAQNLTLLADTGRAVTLAGPSGRYWLYLATPIARGQLAVIVGLPIQPWGWLREDLLLGILIPTAMLALAVLAIWIATDYLVNRHIVTLADSAVAYRQGRVATLPPTDDAPSEIRALAKALTDTAAEVRAREIELEASLRQKDMLLREIHHRIKNNLQIVVSLLNLRAQRLNSPAARTALTEAQTRIKALALVHRHLYEQPEVEAVELHAFLGDLCALIEGHDGVLGPGHRRGRRRPGHRLDRSGDPDRPSRHRDPEQCLQARLSRRPGRADRGQAGVHGQWCLARDRRRRRRLQPARPPTRRRAPCRRRAREQTGRPAPRQRPPCGRRP